MQATRWRDALVLFACIPLVFRLYSAFSLILFLSPSGALRRAAAAPPSLCVVLKGRVRPRFY